MTGRDWIFLLAGLAGGGAAGAIITAIVTKFRSRRQPIGYKIDTIDILRKNRASSSLDWLAVSTESPEKAHAVMVKNLSIARLTLINKGNQDIDEYPFGVTLEGTNKAVDLTWETPDRHHTIETSTPVKLNTPRTTLDFTLKPFNRGEEYIINIYFHYEESPGPIKPSSPHHTRLVEIGATGEAVVEVVASGLTGSLASTVVRIISRKP